MNRTIFLGTLVLATAATSAFAEGITYQGDIAVERTPFVSTRSQADVQAELAQYKKAGVNPWSISYNPLKGFQSARTRAQVEEEFIASRTEVRGMTGEDSGSAYLAQHRVRAVGSQLAGKAPAQQ